MIRRYLALFFLLTAPALAQSARVTSGEHDGFTRLVVDFGRPVNWQIGRDADGYLLRILDGSAEYDLSDAFALIGKSRLAALEAPDSTSDLKFGMGCACHAIPFEFRPGIIVIDLKNGPPPRGSVFESELALLPARPALNLGTEPPETRSKPDLPDARTYDWTSLAVEGLWDARTQKPSPSLDPSVPQSFKMFPPNPDLQPLRDNLVQQFAIGASQGVINFDSSPSDRVLPETTFPSAHIRIGPAHTNISAPQETISDPMGAEGAVCIDPDRLNLPGWGDETLPAMDQLSQLRLGMSREFDRADPAILLQSVRLLLFLGFGAEARQEIAAFGLAAEEAQVLQALGRVLDGDPDHEQMFAGQAACDGPVALWSFLSDTSLGKGDPVNEGAIRLAFSALPMHLRKQIGPRLSERFLAFGNTGAARALGENIGRAYGNPGSSVTLMKARLDLTEGDAKSAEIIARSVLSNPGQNHPEALIALTDARAAQQSPLGPEVVEALEAFAEENRGTPLEARLAEALMLAKASSGDFSGAFSDLQRFPDRAETLWALLARLAPDEAFLQAAVLPTGQQAPRVSSDTAEMLARRLIDLGLGQAASFWLQRAERPDPLLVAEVGLQRRDARSAMTAIAGMTDEAATSARVRALDLLGAYEQQAELFQASGNAEGETLSLAKAGNWARLAETEAGPWQSLSAELTGKPLPQTSAEADPDLGALTKGHALVEASVKTRAEIDLLLSQVDGPVSSGQ